MNCIVIDDEDVSRRLIEDYINRTQFLSLSHSFSNAIDAINFIKTGNDVNLIFLDIEMPEMTGIDFLNTLKDPPQVIIITSMEKYALTAFDYSVTDYLLKPIAYSRFFKAVDKAYSIYQSSKPTIDANLEIFIKKGGALVKIRYSDIMWVEALENYVVINSEQEKFTVHQTMKAIENQLPRHMFKRVHRSFIVNIKYIISIEDNSINVKTPEGKRSVPIGKSFRDKLFQDINLINK